MMLKNRLKRYFSGVKLEKEYPCVDYQQLKDEVKVLLVNKGATTDVTRDHLFLGYKPVIAGVLLPASAVLGNAIQLHFIHHSGKKLAILSLKEYTRRNMGEKDMVFFTGIHADVFLLPPIFRAMNAVLRKFEKKPTGNVHMQGNEYSQVQAMYTVPRKISVISVGSDNLFNMFPTDLHGNAGPGFYIDSLRKAGKACRQVLEFRKVVKADVPLSFMNDVYAMGKNHMKDLSPVTDFPAKDRSVLFHLPLPAGAVAYKELELCDHFEMGIHRILLFETRNEVTLGSKDTVLSCINSHYAQWRINHGLRLTTA